MTDVQAKAPRSLETGADSSAVLLRGLVAHLRQQGTELRKEWARRIIMARLLNTMTDEEIFAEVTSVYDNYVDALETGTFEALQAYARNLSERIIPRGVQTDEVVGVVLLLRDVLARSFFARYRSEEHTSELQSRNDISYAVFCLKKKKNEKPLPHSYPDPNKPKQHT